MYELFIILILTPLLASLSELVYSFASKNKISNPLDVYSNLFRDLKSASGADAILPFGALALSAVVMAALVLFNIDSNLDFLIFAFLLLVARFCYTFAVCSDLHSDFTKFTAFIMTAVGLFVYVKEPVFETLLTIRDVNQFIPWFVSLIFLLASVYDVPFDMQNICSQDMAFFNYSRMLTANLFIAVCALMFYSGNIFLFVLFLMVGAFVSGLFKVLYRKFSLQYNWCVIIFSILFFSLVLLSSH